MGLPRSLSALLGKQQQSGLQQVLVLAGIFWVLILVLGLHRYFSFYASYDQGIFNQVYWNSLHGRFFQSSLSSAVSSAVIHDGQVPTVFYHRLGQHFTPALLLWLPVYALFPSPATLVVLQGVLITAGGLMLYILARQHLQPAIAVMITASYYSANAVIGPTFSNFHDLCQIPLFVFGLLLALEKRRWWLFWLLAVLTLGIREDTGILLFGIGAYLVGSRRYPRLGLLLCGLSFGYVAFVTNGVMPQFSEDVSRRFMIERFGQYAEGEDATSFQILGAMLGQPQRLLAELLTPLDETVNYLLGQWLPLAFVPALSGTAWAIAGLPLLQVFSQQGTYSLALNLRYAISVVPGLFYGAILWWANHPERLQQRVRQFWTFCIALSVVLTLLSSPHGVLYFLIPDSIRPWVYISLNRQWEHVSRIQALTRQIPPEASVSATTYLIPHLSNRREIIRLPATQLKNDQNQTITVDYAIADVWRLQQYQIAYDNDRSRLQALLPTLDMLIRQGRYGVRDVQDGVVLLQRSVASQPQALADWEQLRDSLRSIWQTSE